MPAGGTTGRSEIRLRGRELVVQFVDRALRRNGVADVPAPIVLLTGPHGSGGTALLGKLWDKLHADTPSVYLDLAKARSTDDVIFAAMLDLHRKIRGLPVLRFPRLGLAFYALAFKDTDGDGRPAFETHMRKHGHAKAVQAALQDWAGRVAPLLGTPDKQVAATVAVPVISGLVSVADRWQNKKLMGWYASMEIPGSGTGWEPLWELWQSRHGTTSAVDVDKILCSALLADLRAAFNKPMRLRQRHRNALLLLDNADTVPGVLLKHFVDYRRQSREQDEAADPAVVVAIHHDRTAQPAGEPVSSHDERLRSSAPGELGRWWCPVWLSDLRDTEVAEICTSNRLGVSTLGLNADADFVYQLTGGHPAAARLLATLLGLPGWPFNERDLLGCKIPQDDLLPRNAGPMPWRPGDAGRSVEDCLLKLTMLADYDSPEEPARPSTLDKMAVCAATPGLNTGACIAALNYLGWQDVDVEHLRRDLHEQMWLDDLGEDNARLHPLATLLLRRWLARDPGRWRDVHQGYTDHYTRTKDDMRKYHHTLALAEPDRPDHLAEVSKYLEKKYLEDEPAGCPAHEWISILDMVASAPNRMRTTFEPKAYLTKMAGEDVRADRLRLIARLTAARWLFNDRHFDPRHDLAETIADGFERLGSERAKHKKDNEVFFREARRYRQIAADWRHRS